MLGTVHDIAYASLMATQDGLCSCIEINPVESAQVPK